MRIIVDKELKKLQYHGLKELFQEWKERHLEDDNDDIIRKTFPKGTESEFKKSFCWDGYIGDNKLSKILFVCRESNVYGKPEVNDTFWFKDVAKEKKSKYFNCVNAIANHFNQCVYDCAYMNINKRGGFKKCLMSRLKNYSVLYKNYILKEIELIDPKRIVVLGNLPRETISILLESNKPVYKYPYHPCVYRKDEIAKIKEYII